MLRITIEENPDLVSITLEGRVAGPWADELGRTWDELAAALEQRKVAIDLCNVTYLDADGRRVLKTIYSQSEADFLTSTPLTEYFAEEAMRSGAQVSEEIN